MKAILSIFLFYMACICRSSLADSCGKIADCAACSTNPACGWCLRDGNCYSLKSADSPCPTTMLNSRVTCSITPLNYNEKEADFLAYFSAAAYNDEPSFCMDVLNTTYKIVEVVSAKADFMHDNCVAFVAVSESDKSIIVSYRGTDMNAELFLEVLRDALPTVEHPSGGLVASYFNDAHLALYPRVKSTVRSLLRTYPDFVVYATGHSLGGAMASLASYQLVADGVVPPNQLRQVTFGQPRVGNYKYATMHDALVPHSWRVVHSRDLIPHLPLCVGFTECNHWLPTFAYHHGVEVFYPAEDMNATLPLEHKVCLGKPVNEDQQCSNKAVGRKPCLDITTCVNDHVYYFNRHFANFGINNCTGEINVRCKLIGC